VFSVQDVPRVLAAGTGRHLLTSLCADAMCVLLYRVLKIIISGRVSCERFVVGTVSRSDSVFASGETNSCINVTLYKSYFT